MKPKLLLAAAILTAGTANAQLLVTADTSATMLANSLVGTGTGITNITLTCAPASAGSFSGGTGTAPGISSGVVLSTGMVADIPDSAVVFANSNMGTPGDSALTMVAGMPTYDACVLEFDVTVAGDTLYMDYVFASEEYPEFTCSAFNDAFAFQLSGPKPGGGTYENYNIARTPVGDLPVNVNNINNSTCGAANSASYVDNATGTDIVFDGFTLPLTATAATIPGQTYHMRFGVADAGDNIFDTGVFLSANALRSGGATKVATLSATLPFFMPNPAKDFATMNNVTLQPLSFTILNMMGQIMTEGVVPAGAKSTIQLKNFAAGQYLVRLRSGDQTSVQRLQVVK